jgi:hypothetical protein
MGIAPVDLSLLLLLPHIAHAERCQWTRIVQVKYGAALTVSLESAPMAIASPLFRFGFAGRT